MTGTNVQVFSYVAQSGSISKTENWALPTAPTGEFYRFVAVEESTGNVFVTTTNSNTDTSAVYPLSQGTLGQPIVVTGQMASKARFPSVPEIRHGKIYLATGSVSPYCIKVC